MQDPIEALKAQLRASELRRTRDHEHLLVVMSAQRERVDKAFAEVSLALVEQELALRGVLHRVEEETQSLGTTLLGMLSDHENRLRVLEGHPRPPEP